MRYLSMGCGRMGAGLALLLVQRGHQVRVVDKDPCAFQRLGSTFPRDNQFVGVAFDRDVLLRAGIERVDGLAAVTASDEANVVTARVARQVFHVPRVVARLYDPRKAEIYQRLGLQTISTTTWGVNRIAELLCFAEWDTLLSLGDGGVELIEVEIPPLLAGRTVNSLTIPNEAHVVSISRSGKTFLPTPTTTFEADDHVQVALVTSAASRLQRLLQHA